MLFTPPPGYNSPSVNQQNIGPFNVPGQQGGTAQGYFNPYRSSWATPSSYSVPSSFPVPNPYYSQPHPDATMMAQALRKGQ